MNSLNSFLNSIKGKNVHLIGASGSEGSSLLELLVSVEISQLTAHDFIGKEQLEKNFKLWHKGMSVSDRNLMFEKFKKNLENVDFHDRRSYLEGLDKADIIFVPQSWRLYPQNEKLFDLKNKNIPFYSLMRLYLDYSKAKIIAVTGTVGKGSVAYLICQILTRCGKTAFFTGNETWTRQLADRMDAMSPSDFLVLEISHRQLMDGFIRAPLMTVYTNLYPNHLDELSWQEYCRLKLSLAEKQSSRQISVINYDDMTLRKAAKNFESKIVYFSSKHKNMNIKDIQKLFPHIMNNKSNHYIENILAASTVVILNNISQRKLLSAINDLSTLPARLEKIAQINGLTVYDDIKSTTPWSTIKAISKLSGNLVLIMGGNTKGISYKRLVNNLIAEKTKTIVIDSPLSQYLLKEFPGLKFILKTDLTEAIKECFKLLPQKGNILISPAASNFYSSFIKRKSSIRKIVTSLLPKEPA